MTRAMPADVARVFTAWPDGLAARFRAIRGLILDQAETTGTGPLTETLKWGQPAYLTEATGAGTTLRLGCVQGRAAVLVHCQTRLIPEMGDLMESSGNRAVFADAPENDAALTLFIARALTYHLDRKANRR